MSLKHLAFSMILYVPCLAQDREKLDIKKAIHASRITSMVWPKYPKKSPFETEAAYFEKMFARGKETSFLVPIRFLKTKEEFDINYELRYSPESESFEIDLSDTYHVGHVFFTKETGSYIGENAFGGKSVVKKYDRMIFSFYPSAKMYGTYFDGSILDSPKHDGHLYYSGATEGKEYKHHTLIKIQCSPADALKLKDRFAFLVKGNLVMTEKKKSRTTPTIEHKNQVDLVEYNFYFDKSTMEVFIVDIKTGDIFNKARIQ